MNGIKDAGVKIIANALKTNRGLVGLSLWKNEIGSSGAAELAEVRNSLFLGGDGSEGRM